MLPEAFEKVAVVGAAGNLGKPITRALLAAGFRVTAITRTASTAVFPPDVAVVRTDYDLAALTAALAGQDAVVCVAGIPAMPQQATMVDAAVAAGVRRFIVNDFGWGPARRGLPEFDEILAQRKEGWDRARDGAEETAKQGGKFTWTGITSGNPTDYALRRFSHLLGFEIAARRATIYDAGTEAFTGTTLEGIGQAVVGVLQHPEETANRFVRARSIKTCQNELLAAFQAATPGSGPWEVQPATTRELKERAREKKAAGVAGWLYELATAQLLDKGEARCVVAPTREESDADLLGIREESAAEIVEKATGSQE